MTRTFRIPLSLAIVADVLFLCGGAFAQGQASKPALKTNPPGAARRDPQDAAKLAESGRCPEALPLLKQAAAQSRSEDDKRRVLIDGVRCAMALDQRAVAGDFLGQLGKHFPHDPEVLFVLVHAYSDLSTRASQDLAITAPASPQAHELNAESLEVQGKWDEAAKEYQQILEQNPREAGIHFRIGRLLLSKPNPDPAAAEQAKKEFQQELEIDPQNAGAEYILGELAREANQFPEAVEHFARATKLDVSFTDAFLGLGMTYVSDGKPAEAIPPLETYVRMQPANPAGHYQLAMAYNRAGRKEEAKREAELQRQTAAKIEEEKQKAAPPPSSSNPPGQEAGPPK
jgi:tetratricopeptide (TPR) repeat protein